MATLLLVTITATAHRRRTTPLLVRVTITILVATLLPLRITPRTATHIWLQTVAGAVVQRPMVTITTHVTPETLDTKGSPWYIANVASIRGSQIAA